MQPDIAVLQDGDAYFDQYGERLQALRNVDADSPIQSLSYLSKPYDNVLVVLRMSCFLLRIQYNKIELGFKLKYQR